MKLLIDKNTGDALSSDLYSMVMSSLLTKVLQEYLEKRGLLSLFSCCISNDSSISGLTLNNNVLFSEGNFTWEVIRRPLPTDSDLHWISPADKKTHLDLLKHVGSVGFEVVCKH
jgi:hypothetical protein